MAKGDDLPYTVGSKPNTVRVYRRKGRRNIYIRTWDPSARDGKGDWAKESLGHSDVEKAKVQASKLHAKLVAGDAAIRSGKVTLRRLFALYKKHRTPQKSERVQKADGRQIELWTRVLGAEKDPHKITRAEWEGFMQSRSAGEIDSRGRPKGHEDFNGRGEVGPRSVERDLRFLLAVLNWGTDWRTSDGYLLRENVCRGYPVPKEKNPSRPVATDERVQEIRKRAPEVTMDVTWNATPKRKRTSVPSHLPSIFDLAVETGRRLSAILQLRYSDLRLDRGPHGSIRWPADTDKDGRESTVPISPQARRALDRHVARMRDLGLPGIGDAPLFPAPKDPSKPLGRHVADRWLREAEDKAEDVEPHEGSLWHAYRRRWATVRKHLPYPDVAEAGGWSKDSDALRSCYQHADEDTMYEVVTGGGSLREAK